MAFDICIEIPRLEDPLTVVMPGGITLQHINVHELLQPAFAPLMPMFTTIETVTAIVDVLRALAKMPPDLAAAKAALDKITDGVSKLLNVLPVVSGPRMALGMLDAVLRLIAQARSALVHLQQQATNLLEVERVAQKLGDARLLHVFECVQHNIGQEADNVGRGLAGVGHLLGIIELLMSLTPHPVKMPDIGSLAGQPLTGIVAPLDAVVKALSTTRAAVAKIVI